MKALKTQKLCCSDQRTIIDCVEGQDVDLSHVPADCKSAALDRLVELEIVSEGDKKKSAAAENKAAKGKTEDK